MSVMILFRTLMFAQKGSRVLSGGNVPNEVVKAPRGTEENGCAYGVRFREPRLSEAVRLLQKEGIPYGRILLPDGAGRWREAQV